MRKVIVTLGIIEEIFVKCSSNRQGTSRNCNTESHDMHIKTLWNFSLAPDFLFYIKNFPRFSIFMWRFSTDFFTFIYPSSETLEWLINSCSSRFGLASDYSIIEKPLRTGIYRPSINIKQIILTPPAIKLALFLVFMFEFFYFIIRINHFS